MSAPRLPNWRFGTEPRQRIRLVQCASAGLLMLACTVIGLQMAWIGVAPLRPTMVWAAVSVGGTGVFFALLRSGVRLRFAKPSLSLPQMLFALTGCAWACLLVGRAGGRVFPILMLILMYGMFVLRPNQVRWASLAGVGRVGAAMALMAWQEPAARADRALDDAKEPGRDRVVVA